MKKMIIMTTIILIIVSSFAYGETGEVSKDVLENTIPPTVEVPSKPYEHNKTEIPEFDSLGYTKIIEDVNKDGVVNTIDLVYIKGHYGLKMGINEGYNENYDLNGDGIIDIYDIVMVSKKLR